MSQTRARLAVPLPVSVFILTSSLLPLHIKHADTENELHLTLGKEANECTFKMSNYFLNMGFWIWIRVSALLQGVNAHTTPCNHKAFCMSQTTSVGGPYITITSQPGINLHSWPHY